MLGYLNAPNAFNEEGYFPTGHIVEVEGDYIKIIGRESDIINVGGEKVFPVEVENVISEIPEVDGAECPLGPQLPKNLHGRTFHS